MRKTPFRIHILVVILVLHLQPHLTILAQSKTDSLLMKLQLATELEKPTIFNYLAEMNSENASDISIQYAETALELSRENEDKLNEALALQNLCLGYLYNDIYDKALVNGLAALDIFEQHSTLEDKAYILSTLGWIYYDIQNADLALNYHQKVLDIYLQLENKDNIAFAYNSLGLVHSMKEEYEKALTYYLKSLKIAEEEGLLKRQAAVSNNLGMTYNSLKI